MIDYIIRGDNNLKDSENRIAEIAKSIKHLNDMAYTLHKPSADMYISQLKWRKYK